MSSVSRMWPACSFLSFPNLDFETASKQGTPSQGGALRMLHSCFMQLREFDQLKSNQVRH